MQLAIGAKTIHKTRWADGRLELACGTRAHFDAVLESAAFDADLARRYSRRFDRPLALCRRCAAITGEAIEAPCQCSITGEPTWSIADGPAAVHIRWMIRRDMPEVLAIENDCFGEHAWTERDFTRCLRQSTCIGMVAERDEEVAGFMVYQLRRRRIDLLNLAVGPDYQRRRIGRQLLEKLQGKLTPERRSAILAEVRETNLPAQLFFRSLGFRAVSVRRGAYLECPDDAYLFRYWLLQPVA